MEGNRTMTKEERAARDAYLRDAMMGADQAILIHAKLEAEDRQP